MHRLLWRDKRNSMMSLAWLRCPKVDSHVQPPYDMAKVKYPDASDVTCWDGDRRADSAA